MKIIDRSPYPSTPGWMDWRNRILGTLKYGLRWYSESNAQAQAQAILNRGLNHHYTLIHDLILPGLETSIPFIIVGASGVQLIYVTALKGIFQVKGDSWSMLDAKRQYQPVKPNLVARTCLLAQGVEEILKKNGYDYVKVDPVLMCTDPGIHVETIRPIVRIVMSDAIERFSAGLVQTQAVLGAQEIEEITQLLVKKSDAALKSDSDEDVLPDLSKTKVGKIAGQMTRLQQIILLVLIVLFALVLLILINLALSVS